MRRPLVSVLIALCASLWMVPLEAQEHSCRVVCEGGTVELQSPFFVFTLDCRDGLRARSWHNKRTGARWTWNWEMRSSSTSVFPVNRCSLRSCR